MKNKLELCYNMENITYVKYNNSTWCWLNIQGDFCNVEENLDKVFYRE